MITKICRMLGVGLLVALPACQGDALDLHGCPTEYSSGWGFAGFELTHTEPTTCPVFLVNPGDVKTTGGVVEDHLAQATDTYLTVKDYFGAAVGFDHASFQSDFNGNWSAGISTSYPAGRQSGQPDHARFDVFGFGSLHEWGDMTITYTNQVQASISGPASVFSGGSGSWTANVTTGQPPFTYHWSWEWEPVGTDPSYTGSMNGEGYQKLRLDVYDARGYAASVTRRIYVSPCGGFVCD